MAAEDVEFAGRYSSASSFWQTKNFFDKCTWFERVKEEEFLINADRDEIVAPTGRENPLPST
jgi:hypothetical protein